MTKYRIGYTQGCFDMFHIGHLNLLNHAKEMCDILIVGVNSNSLMAEYKHKQPVIGENERIKIIENIKAVDEAHIADTLNKVEQYKKYHYDALFIGDDWKGNSRWIETEKQLKVYGVEVVYLPHTEEISSTILKPQKERRISDNNDSEYSA